MRYRHLMCLAFTAVLAGCESSPLGSSPLPGDLRATISGTGVSDYHGSGEFRQAPAGLPRPLPFALWSVGSGAAADEGFQFDSNAAPAVGSYALGSSPGAEAHTVHASYTRQSGAVLERFVATQGYVEITVSTPNRIEGTFRFAAALASTCVTAQRERRCTPGLEDGAPTLEAAGTFSAVPSRAVAVHR